MDKLCTAFMTKAQKSSDLQNQRCFKNKTELNKHQWCSNKREFNMNIHISRADCVKLSDKTGANDKT